MMVLLTLLTGLAQADEVKWTEITVKYTDEVLREDLSGVEIYEDNDDPIRLDIDTAYNDKTPPDVQLWAVIEGLDGIIDDVVVTDTDEEKRCVEIDLTVTNERGETPVVGTAIVQLG